MKRFWIGLAMAFTLGFGPILTQSVEKMRLGRFCQALSPKKTLLQVRNEAEKKFFRVEFITQDTLRITPLLSLYPSGCEVRMNGSRQVELTYRY